MPHFAKETLQSPYKCSATLTVLFVCLVLTFVAWYGATLLTEKNNSDYFVSLVDDSEAFTLNRFHLYEQALLGGRGFIRGSDIVTREEWREYVYSLYVEESLPGILGIGYINYVLEEDLPDFLSAARQDGAPNFKNYPETSFEDKFIITYIEPVTKNKEAVGLDIGFESCRRQAAERAWSVQKPSLTCKIELVQDQTKKAGFLLLVPVYGQPDVSAGDAPRLRGWVYAPFIGHAFFDDVPDVSRRQLSLIVYDGEKIDDDKMIFSSDNIDSEHADYDHFLHRGTVTVAGQKWTLVWKPTELFDPRTSKNIASAILIGGILFSFMSGAFVRFLTAQAGNISRQVRVRTQELEEATRAKSEFLARMSHEIRTPMNGILGFVDIVKHTNMTDFQRSQLEKVEIAGRTLLTIINDILDLSKVEAGMMALEERPFSLVSTLSICMDMVRSGVEGKDLEISLIFDKECPKVFVGDQYRLQQIILNLLSNAVKFTREGYVRLEVRYESQNLIITVKDSGIGIAKDKQADIFESFMQEDAGMSRRYGGTGLGLPICKQLVSAMGGTIALDSDKGEGATFTVVLPLEVGSLEEEGEVQEIVSGNAYKILLVEDTPMNQEITVAMLERYGHVVDVEDNGRAAVDAVKEKEYDIVLMDIQMPGMDGVEATREIRETLGKDSFELPIIALTAHTMPEDVARFFEAGIDDYILKPVKAADLVRKIEEVVSDDMMAGAFVPNDEVSAKTHQETLLDCAQYQSLVSILGEDKSQEIYASFCKDAGKRMDSLMNDDLSRDEIHVHLHSMASMAGNIGFKRMEVECRRLMDVMLSLGKGELNEDLYALTQLYEQGLTAFEQCCGPPKA